MTLLSAVRKDRLAGLEALRDTLARAIEDCEGPGAMAPLAKQLRETLAELEKLRPAVAASPVDQIAQKRAARIAGTQVRARAAGKVDGGSGSSGTRGKRRADPGAAPATGARRRAGGKT